MELHFTPSWLARLLGRHRNTVTITASAVMIKDRHPETVMQFARIKRVSAQRAALWSHVHLVIDEGAVYSIYGLHRKDAAKVVAAITVLRCDPMVSSLLDRFSRPNGRDAYLTHSLHTRWMSEADPLLLEIGPKRRRPSAFEEAEKRLALLTSLVARCEEAREDRNAAFVERQRKKYAGLFAKLLGYPLNPEQVQAILHDEDRSLVVAGAGTGKTSTIVGKAAYILQEQLAKPEQVLLLAFTRKAADEMRERLKAVTGAEVQVSTFHALGVRAIAHSTGKAPTVSKMAEDDVALRKALSGIVESLLRASGSPSLIEFLSYLRYPSRPLESFPTPHHYHQHIAGHAIRTLRGERVKSFEECSIADWLTCNGIEYQYEAPYPHDTASVQYRQYQPDFYLPRFEVFIEHFGVNRAGRPPPCFGDPSRYLEGMRWKQETHRRYRTKLVETYSYQATEGVLFAELEAALRKHGVTPEPLRHEARSELLAQQTVINPFVSLLASFLNLYKGNCWTLEEVRSRVAGLSDVRARKFIEVFAQVLGRYEALLADERAIDFSDLIITATRHVAERRFAPGYCYILVDEFQDISRGRARLLQALLAQVGESKLFAVGDDWQAIYRFAGSDIDLMTRFPAHFGFTRRTDLRETHRFTDKLLQAGSTFITVNPQQLQKSLVAQRTSTLPAVEVVSTGDGAHDTPLSGADRRTDEGDRRTAAATRAGLEHALTVIAQDARDAVIDVLVLGRYWFVIPSDGTYTVPDRRIRVRTMTVHQAKGLEADYVVVLDVVGGRYGFPTEIVDDPLLELVLAGANAIPNAEERRLFYVSLTRARRKVYVVTHDTKRSVFVDELESPPFAGLVVRSGAANRTVACPACKGGRLVRREGQWGLFWGCSNYPLCEQKARACPWCGAGAFVPGPVEFRCASPECGKSAPLCPRCRVGALVPRYGRYGPFVGCTEWRSQGPSCGYTRSR